MEPDRVNLRSNAVNGVGWAAALKLGSQVGSLLTFVILARLLSPQDFGLVALASVIVMLVTMLCDLSVSHYLVQQIELKRGAIDSVFWIAFGSGVFVALVVGAAAPWVAAAFNEPRMTAVLLALALTVPITSLSAVPHALLRRSLAFNVLTVRGLAAVLVSGTVGVVLALAGFGVWALVAQAYALPVVSVFMFYRVTDWRPRLAWDRAESMAIVRYGASLWGMSSLQFLRTRADDLIVGAILGSVSLGVYTVAKRVVLHVCDLFAGVALQVVPPVLAAAKEDPDRVRRGYLVVVAATSAIIAPVTLYLAAMSGVVVPFLFGSQWEGAAVIAQVTALGASATVLASLDRGVLLALNLPTVELRTSAVTTVLVLGATAAAAPWGLLPLTVTGVVANYLAWGWRVRVLRNKAGIPVRDVIGLVAPVGLAAAAAAGIAFAALLITQRWHDAYSILAASAVVLLAYPALLRLLAGPVLSKLRPLLPDRLRRHRSANVIFRCLLGSPKPLVNERAASAQAEG